ncbi:hypothetical protein GQ600_5764 [Phytophthora cactorum]|nr:hypothetical protein GQ600_5764 [Phytophthora cactorum]
MLARQAQDPRVSVSTLEDYEERLNKVEIYCGADKKKRKKTATDGALGLGPRAVVRISWSAAEEAHSHGQLLLSCFAEPEAAGNGALACWNGSSRSVRLVSDAIHPKEAPEMTAARDIPHCPSP